ncbi:MAG: hypothetical protein ACK40X_05375 [Armatimonadota bacterium]
MATSVGISVGGKVGIPILRPGKPYNMTLCCHAPVVAHTPRSKESALGIAPHYKLCWVSNSWHATVTVGIVLDKLIVAATGGVVWNHSNL